MQETAAFRGWGARAEVRVTRPRAWRAAAAIAGPTWPEEQAWGTVLPPPAFRCEAPGFASVPGAPLTGSPGHSPHRACALEVQGQAETRVSEAHQEESLEQPRGA